MRIRMDSIFWTEPYFGVQHLSGLNRNICAQITVEDHGSFARLTVFPPKLADNFFSGAATTQHDTAEQARHAGMLAAIDRGALGHHRNLAAIIRDAARADEQTAQSAKTPGAPQQTPNGLTLHS